MKKNIELIVVGIVVLIAGLVISIWGKKEHNFPYERITFVQIEGPYIGSYYITRTNLGQQWQEYGEWESTFLQDTTVCFGYFSINDHATFRHDDNHEWIPTKKAGRDCLKLVKKD